VSEEKDLFSSWTKRGTLSEEENGKGEPAEKGEEKSGGCQGDVLVPLDQIATKSAM